MASYDSAKCFDSAPVGLDNLAKRIDLAAEVASV